jgi:hypothetical protein
MKVITHKFNDWGEIPDVSHLLKIKNNYVRVFESECQKDRERYITYISYVVENDIIVSFGSASYYDKGNYYCNNTTRQLWIEGLVSISKGCGTIVLHELEKILSDISYQYDVKDKIINIMSVSDSVAFYENNGYYECNTSSYWRGCDCIRMAKPIDNFNMISAKIRENWEVDAEWIYGYIIQGRRRILDKYTNIPTSIHHKDFSDYIINNYENTKVFKDNVNNDVVKDIVYLLINGF